MYAISLAIDVNPPGAAPPLTRDQVWRGLVMKAEDAVPFVPGMTRCEAVERAGPDRFTREVEFKGQTFRERVVLTEPVQVLFEREADTPNAGWITNVVSERDGGLLLTFTFAVRFPGTDEGSDVERRAGDEMRSTYEAAITSTLAKVREMAESGEIA